MGFKSLTREVDQHARKAPGQRHRPDALMLAVHGAKGKPRTMSITLYRDPMAAARFQVGDPIDLGYNEDTKEMLIRRCQEGRWRIAKVHSSKNAKGVISGTIFPGMPFNGKMSATPVEWIWDEDEGGLVFSLPNGQDQ